MRYLNVLLIAVLAAGCASARITVSSVNQEGQIQKLLTGTWEGYIKDTHYTHIVNHDRTLVIYGIQKEQNGWTIDGTLNGESLEYIKLNVYGDTVMLEMMDNYGGLYNLELYKDTHLLGTVDYDRGAWRLKSTVSNEVVFKKISG